MTCTCQVSALASLLFAACGAAFSQASLPYKNYAPVWSPHGNKIAFFSTRDGDWEIYTINSDGTQLIRLTNSPGYDGEPSWSPDGRKIAFTSDRDGDDEIFIMNADGSNIVQVTRNELPDEGPAWSPTSDEILYRSLRGDSRYVFLTSIDGSRNRRLSSVAAKGRVRWSGDGREIVFVIDYQDRQAIYRMSRAGNQLDMLLPTHNFPGNPAFSPDHKSILYDAHINGIGDSGDGLWELWQVAMDGTMIRRLTRNDVDDWGGQWSPDGEQFVYAGGGLNNAGYEIMIADISGADTRQLTDRQE